MSVPSSPRRIHQAHPSAFNDPYHQVSGITYQVSGIPRILKNGGAGGGGRTRPPVTESLTA